MGKLTKLERYIVVVTVFFVAFTGIWFWVQNSRREVVRVTVSRTAAAAESVETAPDNEAPGMLPGERLNVNTASAEDLERLPGIGEKRAADIIAYREANGPFEYPEQLTEVPGIGEATMQGLLDYITTEDPGGGS